MPGSSRERHSGSVPESAESGSVPESDSNGIANVSIDRTPLHFVLSCLFGSSKLENIK